MAEHGIQEKLVDYLKDAHAMETNVSQMLDSMIATTDDEATRRELEHHREETERHRELLADRLRAHGADVSIVKESKALGSAIVKAFTDMAGGDQPEGAATSIQRCRRSRPSCWSAASRRRGSSTCSGSPARRPST